jgi:hypothetical protein
MRSSIVRRSSGADDVVVELRGLANVLLPRTMITRELSALVEYLRLDHIWSGLSCEPCKGACDQGQVGQNLVRKSPCREGLSARTKEKLQRCSDVIPEGRDRLRRQRLFAGALATGLAAAAL